MVTQSPLVESLGGAIGGTWFSRLEKTLGRRRRNVLEGPAAVGWGGGGGGGFRSPARLRGELWRSVACLIGD